MVREYFGAHIMGTVFGAVAAGPSLGMALAPHDGPSHLDRLGRIDHHCAFANQKPKKGEETQ